MVLARSRSERETWPFVARQLITPRPLPQAVAAGDDEPAYRTVRGAMGSRPRPIRLTLVGLFVVPMLSLLALWGYAASVTLGNAIQERDYSAQDAMVGTPADTLAAQLTQERLQAFMWLSTDRQEPVQPLAAAQQRTDAAVAALRRGADAARGVMFASGRAPLAKLFAKLGQLRSIRAAYSSGTMGALAAFQAYNGIVDAEFQLYNSLSLVSDVPLYQQSVVSIEGGRALDLAGREVALVSGALASLGDQMSTADRELFATTVANQRLLMGDVLSQLNPDLRAGYQRLFSSPDYRRFQAIENRISSSIGSTGPVPVFASTWQEVAPSFLAGFNEAAQRDRSTLAADSRRLGDRLLVQVALAGGLGLIALAASVFVLLRFGRRLTQELTGLHVAARSMAEERLPWIVERLRQGEAVDVQAESPPPVPGSITETARVAAAFATVQRTAVAAAVGQAELRESMNRLFLNLSRRNQSLLHRQLSMLDSMERRTSEPAELADLFRLDHLTTRMRRHAESLIILSGEVPARGWRDPVPVVDVLRAAVAEVEDYVRVEVIAESPHAMVGNAVNDVIHLLAELIENATAFSPPTTRVVVRADEVGSGFAVEVEDRGLGLTAEELTSINERLARPPEFDLSHSDQLGMFVVGRLAAKHKIKVSLRGSPYGGTTAIVLMPRGLVGPTGQGTQGTQGEPGEAIASLSARGGPVSVRGTNSGLRPVPARPVPAGPVPAGPVPPGPVPPGPTPAGPVPAGPAEQSPASQPLLVGRHRTASPPEPVPLLPPAGPQAAVAGAGTHLGLPRRLRQASLAPQLRDSPPQMLSAPLAQADLADARTPDQARSLMSSLQQGWQRGRTDEIQRTSAEPGSAETGSAETGRAETGDGEAG
jgi:signal transduction histidine kinase